MLNPNFFTIARVWMAIYSFICHISCHKFAMSMAADKNLSCFLFMKKTTKTECIWAASEYCCRVTFQPAKHSFEKVCSIYFSTSVPFLFPNCRLNRDRAAICVELLPLAASHCRLLISVLCGYHHLPEEQHFLLGCSNWL